MVEKAEIKAESLLNLDDLLQCPVCYEIPSGQIFQCNEGHHVCGRCKVRLDVCPVCRALFFGTRNYAMEELIANFRKLKSEKSGPTTTGSSETSRPKERVRENPVVVTNEEDTVSSSVQTNRAPPACKGLFRCMCCKPGSTERLPAARLLNHLRYFHRSDLLEGHTENEEYLQAWQISTAPGRIATAIRVAEMGIFFLIIEITNNSVCAWLSMASSPWIAHTFNYCITICGNDREAIFSDCVWSVRACEGTLKKRGHCLMVASLDAQAMIAPSTVSIKLYIRRTPADQIANQSQPRAVLRIANRVNRNSLSNVEPFLEEFTNDMTRLFATLDRGASALERQMRSRLETASRQVISAEESQPDRNEDENQPLSRNARRRLRLRLRSALQVPADTSPVQPRSNHGRQGQTNSVHPHNSHNGFQTQSSRQMPQQAIRANSPPVSTSTGSGSSNARPQNTNRTNKKNRNRR